MAGLLLCLASPPAASARAFSFGTGDVPDIALDRGGSAHLVWAARSGVLYCGIIRGGEACGKPRTLYGSGLRAGRPHILVAGPGRLVVSLGDGPCPGSRAGLGFCTYVRRSSSDGVSFGPPQAIAAPEGPEAPAGPNTFGDAIYGPGESISYASATDGGVSFLNAPLGGGIEQRFARLADPVPGATGAVIGLFDERTPVVAFADTGESQTLYWQAYRGTAGLDEAAGWTPPQPVESGVHVLENDAIAAGPAGLFAMYQRGPVHGVQHLVVRRFDGAGFGPATMIGEPLRGGGYPTPADLAEDASGRLHAAWIDYRSRRIRAAASTAGGATWGRPFTIAAGKALPRWAAVGSAPRRRRRPGRPRLRRLGGRLGPWRSTEAASSAARTARPARLLPAAELPHPRRRGEARERKQAVRTADEGRELHCEAAESGSQDRDRAATRLAGPRQAAPGLHAPRRRQAATGRRPTAHELLLVPPGGARRPSHAGGASAA